MDYVTKMDVKSFRQSLKVFIVIALEVVIHI